MNSFEEFWNDLEERMFDWCSEQEKDIIKQIRLDLGEWAWEECLPYITMKNSNLFHESNNKNIQFHGIVIWVGNCLPTFIQRDFWKAVACLGKEVIEKRLKGLMQ